MGFSMGVLVYGVEVGVFYVVVYGFFRWFYHVCIELRVFGEVRVEV